MKNMMRYCSVKRLSMTGVVVLLTLGLMTACNDSGTAVNPSASGDAALLTNYAHMGGGSTAVNGQQYNWVLSDWGSFPFDEWIYAEVNQQNGLDLEPGEGQLNVTLTDVELKFSGLPSSVDEIVVAIKDRVEEREEETYTEIDRYAVVDGSVTIPVSYANLIAYFGPTHYSVWFKILGGDNGQGTISGASIEILGNANGQQVNLMKDVQLGTPEPPSVAPVSVAPVVVSASEFALDFDGTNDNVALPAFGTLSQLTIDFWCKADTFTNSGFNVIWNSNVYNGANLHLQFRTTAGGVTTLNFARKAGDETFAYTFNAGTWYHVGVQYSSTAGNVKLFINGALQETITTSPTAIDATVASKIGSYNASRFFDGIIDEFSLSGTQNAYWNFNEGTGTTAADSVGGFDGTVNGATWTTETP